MKLTDLRPPKGTVHRRKRVGRGGKLGKTCCRGFNGQNCRSGGGKGPGFEGGQTPWYMRLPKFRGFKNRNRKEYQIVCLDDLDIIEGTKEITPEILFKLDLIKKKNEPVKVLGNGEVKKPIFVKAHKFSRSAKQAIEEAGGKAEVI